MKQELQKRITQQVSCFINKKVLSVKICVAEKRLLLVISVQLPFIRKGDGMQEWNAVISVREHGFRQAFDVFGDFSEMKHTEFFNILLLRARDVAQMLETLRERAERSPESLVFLARLIPVPGRSSSIHRKSSRNGRER